MKKMMYVSGAVTALLLIMLLTGWTSADDAVKKAMRQGNQQFEMADYSKALSAYETGLFVASESKSLNFNAAQAAYLLNDYEKALAYFEKSKDTIEKFLTAGNICYRAGNAVQDINQKEQFYTQALQFYKEGIILYPHEISLKYNYELVKEKLEELLENKEQENSEQENSEQGEDGDNQESEDQESSNEENSQGSQEQDSEQAEETGDNQSQSQEGDGEQDEGYSQDEGENTADQEAVERILQMLEGQEEQSLKNNQEVIGGNEGKNGW